MLRIEQRRPAIERIFNLAAEYRIFFHRTGANVRIHAGAYAKIFHAMDQPSHKFYVRKVFNVDSLDAHANAAAVRECAIRDALNRAFQMTVCEYKACVFSAQFKNDGNQVSCGSLCNELAITAAACKKQYVG